MLPSQNRQNFFQRVIRAGTCSSLLLLSALAARGQGTFQNLGFENTTLTGFLVNPLNGYYATNAAMPGWNWSPYSTFGIGDPYTTVAFNNAALSSAAVTLHGTSSPIAPAIGGSYSVFLQGGSGIYGHTGASIFQTSSIPVGSRSILFSGRPSLQLSFNGQMLTPFALSNAATYTFWGADISAYAGQSGELRFTVPLGSESILDDIQFSPTSVPEPSTAVLFGLGVLILFGAMKRQHKQTAALHRAAPSHLLLRSEPRPARPRLCHLTATKKAGHLRDRLVVKAGGSYLAGASLAFFRSAR